MLHSPLFSIRDISRDISRRISTGFLFLHFRSSGIVLVLTTLYYILIWKNAPPPLMGKICKVYPSPERYREICKWCSDQMDQISPSHYCETCFSTIQKLTAFIWAQTKQAVHMSAGRDILPCSKDGIYTYSVQTERQKEKRRRKSADKA